MHKVQLHFPRRRLRAWLFRWLLVFLYLLLVLASRATEPTPALDAWLQLNSGVDTFSANYTQTRHLAGWKTTAVSSGKFWVKRPRRLRWETGAPPRSILTFAANRMVIFYPREMRVETRSFGLFQRNDPATDGQASQPDDPALEVLSAIEKCFAKTRSDLERGSVIDLTLTEEGRLKIQLDRRPGTPVGKHSMKTLVIVCDPKQAGPVTAELCFLDGGIVRIEVQKPRLNEALDESIFEQAIPDKIITTDR